MSEIACNIIGVKKYRPSVQFSYGVNGVDLTLVRRHALHIMILNAPQLKLHICKKFINRFFV